MPGIDLMIVSFAQWTRMAFVKAHENRSGKSYKLVLVLLDDITLDWRNITLTDFGTLPSKTLLLIAAGNYSDRWIQFVNGDGQELGI